jgi:hypothetical protein
MQLSFPIRLSLAFLVLLSLSLALGALGGIDQGSCLHSLLLARLFNIVRLTARSCSWYGVEMAASLADKPGGVNEAHG